MARPLKHDYAEVDRMLASGMTAYEVAAKLNMSVQTIYHHQKTGTLDMPASVSEKLGAKPVKFPWGTVYVSDEPTTLYKFVPSLNDNKALAALGELVIFELGMNAAMAPLVAIVTNKASVSKEMEAALKEYGITILLKGEL